MRRLFGLLLALAASALSAQMPHGDSTGHAPIPTITLVHKYAVSLNCTTTTCPSTPITSTGSGNALVVTLGGIVVTGPAADYISAITGITCNAPGWNISTTWQSYDHDTAATSAAVCLSVAAAQTSLGITITGASTQAGDLFVEEYHTTGSGFSAETPVAPQLITACTTCTGSAIPITGLNDVLVSVGTPSHNDTAVAAPYSNSQLGPAEASYEGDHFPTVSGAIGSFTQSTLGNQFITTIALYDNF